MTLIIVRTTPAGHIDGIDDLVLKIRVREIAAGVEDSPRESGAIMFPQNLWHSHLLGPPLVFREASQFHQGGSRGSFVPIRR
jgi:hypothetical protein